MADRNESFLERRNLQEKFCVSSNDELITNQHALLSR